MGICPSLEIATKNQNYLESLTSAAQFRLIDLFLAMTVYLPVWHSHCTRARFTVVMSYSGELVVHSCQFLCLQGDVRVARLVFLGQISEFWPGFKVVDLKNFIWPFGLVWLQLKLVRLKFVRPFDFFWQFCAENVSSWRKILPIHFNRQNICKLFVVNVILDRCQRFDVSKIWSMEDSK